MTLDECREHIGGDVVYRPHPSARAEDGEIVRVSEAYAFVLFVGDRQPKACRSETLWRLS